ncbi:MAG: hypothetical protein IPL28_26350 [Chloroflexi bacterium]|nr:hypothetical protein [Chloroflexota bacterium]
MTTKIYLEKIQAALEATRGTAIADPTHVLPMISGTVTPQKTLYEPEEMVGIITKQLRHTRTRNWGEFEIEMAADTAYLPFLMNMAVIDEDTPTTPGGGTNSRLWTFIPSETADDIKTATLWSGDENVQTWVSDFAAMQTLTFSNDATNEDGATVSVSGLTNAPAKDSAPTPAARITTGKLLPAMAMNLWLDTSSGIGTTAISGRLITVTHEISTGVEVKYIPTGSTTTFDYSALSRNAAARRLVTTITLELPDSAQYDVWAADTVVKCRVRHSGQLIEGSLYHYAEFDTYGPLKDLEWGEHATGNRTVSFTIESQYDTTLAAPFRVAIQNVSTTL